MRTQNVHAASPQRRRALLHHFIGLFFMNCVGQGMRRQHRFFPRWRRQAGSVSRNAAGENELPDRSFRCAIRLSNGFHHTRCASHVDLPHALSIKHAGAHRIDHERKMNHRNRTRLMQQFVKYPRGGFLPQIELLELQR